MNADYIENIIRNIEDQSYRCILIDGAWGIGKSYMVEKALEDLKGRTCFVSLFGMDNAQQIYHEILFQLFFQTPDGGKMVKWLRDATKFLGNFNWKAKTINTVLESRFSEQDAVVILSRRFETKHVIVIDDLERCENNLSLRQVFGVVEALKQCNNIQVVIIANTDEIEAKEDFEKYNEKVIDRVFRVTEYSNKVKWGELYVEPGFAVVVEDIDRIYYTEYRDRDNRNNEKRLQYMLEDQSNKIESRLRNYTRHLKSSEGLVNAIYGYYKNQIALTKEEIMIQYKLYQSTGDKANYYKSDEELERYLDSWKSGLENISNSPVLTKTAGEYDYWFVFLDRNDTELICVYKEKIIELLIKEVQEQEYEPMRYYRLNEFHTQTDNIKAALDEGYDVAIYTVVKKYVRYLVNTMDDVTAEKYSRALVEWYRNSDKLKKIIASELQVLYKRSSFPADNMNDHKYAASYNVLEMLYKNNKVYFEQYYADLKKDFDKMSTKRTDNMLNEIKQNNSGD